MAEDIKIAPGKVIGNTHPCFIIAEIGQNHQGDIQIAKQLIKAAKDSGADCVKFQKSCLSEKFNFAALARPYRGPHSWGETYGEHKQFLEFSLEQFRCLQEYAHMLGILFSASAMDMVSVDDLDSINVPFLKIGSGDADNFPLLQHAALKNRPLIISTARHADYGDSEADIQGRQRHHVQLLCSPLCLLLSYSSRVCEPTSHQDLQAGVPRHPCWLFWPRAGNCDISSSSFHGCQGSGQVLERHLTLDKSWKGSDHVCSLTPNEFSKLVSDVRSVESALGSPTKRRHPCEKACYEKLGKTLVATRRLQAGHMLKLSDMKAKVAEPKGCPAAMIQELVRKTLNKTVEHDDSILHEYIS